MNKLVSSLAILLLCSCDGVNSSYDLKKSPVPPTVIEKPLKCTVDFSKTCWPETVKKITACLQKSNPGDFSFDKKFCTNDQKMLVEFGDPIALFSRPFDAIHTPIDFRILPNSKNECFRIEGTRNNFEVTISQTGEKVHFVSDSDGIQFNCLDGQNVKVDLENFEGCQKIQGDGYLKTIPGVAFNSFSDKGVTAGWSFSFSGAPQSPAVFTCYF